MTAESSSPGSSGADPRPLSGARKKALRDAGSRAGRERRGVYLLEGPKAIEDALGRGVEIGWIVASDRGAPDVERWAEAGLLPPSLELYRATPDEMAELSDTVTPQGVLAVGEIPSRHLDDLPDLPEDLGRVVLLVDGVQDPGNLGTLLRTLAAAGGRLAICVKGTVDPYNPKALRGAAGATFGLAIAYGVERGAAVEWCAARGIAIVSLEAGGPNLFGASLPEPPLELAVGGEGAGLSIEILDRSAVMVGLPMESGVESLSAAVAGSIALYALAHDLAPGKGRRS
ncbi:MAG: RNA methyltransferase [Gemmatimonadota bacterium]|nr:RNA methyltransferase [Gemmatimonadota bacterium]